MRRPGRAQFRCQLVVEEGCAPRRETPYRPPTTAGPWVPRLLGRHIVNLVTQLAAIAGLYPLAPRIMLKQARAAMNREELFTSIEAACPGRDDIVYLERRGDEYDWRMVPVGDAAVGALRRPMRVPTSGCRFRPPGRGRSRAVTGVLRRHARRAGVDGRQSGPVSLADRRTVAALPLTGGHHGLSDQPRGPSEVQALPAAVGFRVAAAARSEPAESVMNHRLFQQHSRARSPSTTTRERGTGNTS